MVAVRPRVAALGYATPLSAFQGACQRMSNRDGDAQQKDLGQVKFQVFRWGENGAMNCRTETLLR